MSNSIYRLTRINVGRTHWEEVRVELFNGGVDVFYDDITLGPFSASNVSGTATPIPVLKI